MAARRQLKDALGAFERIERDFAQNSGQQDPDWRRKIIDLRRELQDGLVRIRTALQAVEEADGSTPASQKLAAELSAIRSAIALHQAEWPAVAIDTSNPAYRTAVRELRGATDEFRETAKAVTAALGV